MLSFKPLLAELLWMEYEDAAQEARTALLQGDKLAALTLAVWAYKIKQKYMCEMHRLLFG